MKKNISYIVIFLSILSIYSCSQDDSSIIDGLPDSEVNNDPPGSPPRAIFENFNGHSMLVNRQYFDAFTGVYYDSIIDRSVQWPFTFFSNTWEYVTDTYGDFGNENVLYVIGHGQESESFYRTIFDEDAESRSLIDINISSTDSTGASLDEPVSLIANLVQNSAKGVHLSPAQEVWKTKFTEIFVYDLYKSLALPDTTRVKSEYMQANVDYPNPGTYWFKDWFFPIYNTYSGATSLNNFFNILSQNYPIDGNNYARNMNLGELVHFFSGATGEDLEPLAESAFDWTQDNMQELLQARAEFPNLNYPFEPASELLDLTGEATITVSKDNGGGADANEGSLKLIDNDINTKFLTDGFPMDVFWMQQNFSEAKVVNKYTLTSGNDAPDRDLKTWTLSGSNDGVNFEVLDTRTDQEWTGRNQTKEFNVDNETPYQYYRIDVQSNNGSTLLQVSEWRLLNLKLLDFGPEDLTVDAVLSVTAENGGGANGAEGSTKLIDDDENTKFLTDWTPEFAATQEIAEERIITKYTLTSGNDAPDRDMKSWTLSASNDGENFEVIDTRTNESFENRNQTKDYYVNSQTAYKYYRWNVTELKGGTVFQVSEWRVFADN